MSSIRTWGLKLRSSPLPTWRTKLSLNSDLEDEITSDIHDGIGMAQEEIEMAQDEMEMAQDEIGVQIGPGG